MRSLLSAIGARLSGLRYALADGIYAVRRVPGWVIRRVRGGWDWVVRRVSGGWDSIDVYTQRRIAAVSAAIAALALIWLVLVPVAPCQLPGGDRCPPDDDAEQIVPADALAYLHVNLDSDTEQAQRARELAAKLPALSAELRRLAAAVPGLGLDLGDWFEGEVASVLLPRGGGSDGARTIVMLEAGDEPGARRFARELVGPGSSSSRHRGIGVLSGGDRAAAITGGFLVAGELSAVKRVIDTEAGEAPSLAESPEAESVRDDLPDARFGDAFVSESGGRRLIRPGAGFLSLLEPFVNPEASRAAAGAVVITGEGVELALVSDQDPELTEEDPGFFGAFEDFDPELPERLAPGALAYLGLGRPAEGARELISGAAAGAPAIAAAIEGLARALQRQGQISLIDQVLPLLGDEAALAMGPPGRGAGGAVPYLALLTRGIDEEQAAKDMARLQGPIGRAVGARGGGSFEPIEVGDATALSLRASPTVELTYSIFDDSLVFGTQPDAVEAARAGDGLADSELFDETMSGLGGSQAALFFADIRGLVALGEQAGLAEDPAYAVFASDLRRLRALGALVGREENTISTRVRLVVD